MAFNIDIEIDKLNEFMNNKEIPLFKHGTYSYSFTKFNIKIEYLFYVLGLTCNHPKIEIYLEQILENYCVSELNNLDAGYTLLHHMVQNLFTISLNSFEIIINFGLDVNSLDEDVGTPLHIIPRCLMPHISLALQNVIVLFAKYGANLNILDRLKRTILDKVTYYKLNEHCKIVIMTLVDLGAKTNNPYENADTDLLEFIESYRSSNIKRAIKN